MMFGRPNHKSHVLRACAAFRQRVRHRIGEILYFFRVLKTTSLFSLAPTKYTAVPPCRAHQVLIFYCTRRSEAYEPILCTLVGPLFSMGLDPPAVSAMLNPLVGSLTLFLGRGMTHAVRDLAWAHAHRRLHDLCTYHDPELVQHLNR